MGQEKSMPGGGKDLILRPRPAPLPSLIQVAIHFTLKFCFLQCADVQFVLLCFQEGSIGLLPPGGGGGEGGVWWRNLSLKEDLSCQHILAGGLRKLLQEP